MAPFEIVLIIAGIACVIISFFVEGKSSDTDRSDLDHIAEQLALKKLSETGDQITKLKNDAIAEAQKELAKVSNEKIMAVHEYSDQVLGSIEKNHQEVMFLYTMLTSKEEEMKETVTHLQQTKKEVERFCSMTNDEYANVRNHVTHEEHGKARTHHSSEDVLEQEQLAQMFQSGDNAKHTSKKYQTTKKNKNLLEDDVTEKTFASKKDNIETQAYSEHIDDILRLSKEGLTIKQISKELSLGQGEVKLVLDFHKKKN